jgi:hypothetical protein
MTFVDGPWAHNLGRGALEKPGWPGMDGLMTLCIHNATSQECFPISADKLTASVGPFSGPIRGTKTARRADPGRSAKRAGAAPARGQ